MMSVDESENCPTKLPLEKFAEMASAFFPSVRPSRISSASAPVFTTVSVVWTSFPSRTPRRLIQVRTAMLSRPTSRCGERPS
jgi:hypothetical protein